MKHSHNARLAAVALLVVTAAAAAWATAGRRSGEDRLRVENKTRALTVESVKEVAGARQGTSRFEVTVRNGYDKPITVYRLRVADKETDDQTINAVERGGMAGDWSLSAGGADVTDFSSAPEGEVMLTVAAVLFEDGIGDGHSEDLLRLQEVHAGMNAAFQKIVPLLRRAVSADGPVAPDEAIRLLDDEVASIADSEVPVNQRRGFAEAKNCVRMELGGIRSELRSRPNLQYRTEVTKKLEQLEKALAKR